NEEVPSQWTMKQLLPPCGQNRTSPQEKVKLPLRLSLSRFYVYMGSIETENSFILPPLQEDPMIVFSHGSLQEDPMIVFSHGSLQEDPMIVFSHGSLQEDPMVVFSHGSLQEDPMIVFSHGSLQEDPMVVFSHGSLQEDPMIVFSHGSLQEDPMHGLHRCFWPSTPRNPNS
uniref:Uncharacterized protein n=1 Tax=Anolis carolinensis TaxID=28377 RepID=A0A803SRY1_ANOCA